MKKAWLWMKRHALWILGGIAALLGAILAIKYEREKIAKLKDKARIAGATKEIEVLKTKRKGLEKAEKTLELRDGDLGKKISGVEKQRKETKKAVGNMTNTQITARFRALYSFSKKRGKNGKRS